MNRLNLSYEARQSLQNARRTVEAAIKAAKAITRKPHTVGSGASEAQSQLLSLKRQATLIYITIAATHRREHCAKAEEALAALRKRASSPYLSDTEKLIVSLYSEPVPKQAVSATPSVAA